MLVCLSCRELPTKEFSCKNSLSVYNFLLETICLYMIRPLHLQLKCQVSFFSQYTIDHYCLCCWVKNIWGRFFFKKTQQQSITDVLQQKIFRLPKISFFNGRILPMGKNSRCCCSMRTWQHLSWKKIPQIFQAQKIKYLVQIFYFVSQFMINAHLFVADVVVALIQLGNLRQN